MRLFSALPLTSDCVDLLTSFRLRWSAPGDGLRWSTPEQWHITVRFYGEVDENQSRCLDENFGKLEATAPQLALAGLDLFELKGILVASVESSPELTELHAQVATFGDSCGVSPASHPFRPHITLARSKGRAGNASLKRLSLGGLPSLGPTLRWFPKECLLIEALLRPHGAEYTVRSRAQLKGWLPL